MVIFEIPTIAKYSDCITIGLGLHYLQCPFFLEVPMEEYLLNKFIYKESKIMYNKVSSALHSMGSPQADRKH